MRKLYSVALLLLVLFLISCTPSQTQCSSDTECAPAACCHANAAVNEQYAPSCTMECRPGTIDCGQGSIKCVQNECTVVLNE